MTTLNNASQKQLRQYVDQLERLDEDRRGIVSDMADKLKEAKGAGFDPKILRLMLARRRLEKAEREERDAVLATYEAALEGTPLGSWADKQTANELASV